MMEFLTLYNLYSSLWNPNKPDSQPKNHLALDDLIPLCGIKNVEWMGGMATLSGLNVHDTCKRCFKKAIKIDGNSKTQKP